MATVFSFLLSMTFLMSFSYAAPQFWFEDAAQSQYLDEKSDERIKDIIKKLKDSGAGKHYWQIHILSELASGVSKSLEPPAHDSAYRPNPDKKRLQEQGRIDFLAAMKFIYGSSPETSFIPNEIEKIKYHQEIFFSPFEKVLFAVRFKVYFTFMYFGMLSGQVLANPTLFPNESTAGRTVCVIMGFTACALTIYELIWNLDPLSMKNLKRKTLEKLLAANAPNLLLEESSIGDREFMLSSHLDTLSSFFLKRIRHDLEKSHSSTDKVTIDGLFKEFQIEKKCEDSLNKSTQNLRIAEPQDGILIQKDLDAEKEMHSEQEDSIKEEKFLRVGEK